MKFTFADKEYECNESQYGEWVDIYCDGGFYARMTVHDVEEAKWSLFPSDFVLAYIAACKNNH